jgi:hypothetical protein
MSKEKLKEHTFDYIGVMTFKAKTLKRLQKWQMETSRKISPSKS